ncbi:MAG: alpha-amylase, partial [Prevotella sp.]|nr:alpha-amylase [Prevotella sp.]
GFDQTSDLDFKNGGYYNEAGACQGIVTDIEAIRTTPSTKDNVIYDLQGRKVSKEQLKKGLYIVNGKKVVTK